MNDITATIDRYFALWTEPDAIRRKELIQEAFADGATYTGPLLDGSGHEGIAQLAARLYVNLDGHRFVRTSEIDSPHNAVRYSWEILPPGGSDPFAAGFDFALLDEHGRLTSVTAFLDIFPEHRHDDAP